MTLAWLPKSTTVKQMVERGLGVGLMSAGLGSVPAEQTYLDITQGNRVFDSLYDEELPPLFRNGPNCSSWWNEVEERAETVPADIIPALLSKTLADAGMEVPTQLRWEMGCLFSAAGTAPRSRPGSGVFEVVETNPIHLASRLTKLRPGDLLIAVAKPPPADNRPLPIGIAGAGFEGGLTSDSTRTEGYVLSTDIGRTVLDWFGLPVPDEMTGEPIRAAGDADPAALEELSARMAVIAHRRGPVIGYSLLAWLAGLALASALGGSIVRRVAVKATGLAVVYLPLVLLAGAAIEPGEAGETLLVMLCSPALAGLTLSLLRGYGALAVAAAATVVVYAIDMVAGSPLTSLSLLGPNPGLGVRFYGIGNELEAILAVLVVAGTGAALTGFAPRQTASRSAALFLAVGLSFAFVFAAGRFGADVGAAIVLPLGSAVAAYLLVPRRRGALLVVMAPFAAVALLALADLVSGANAHLTRSVLDAGGMEELADVAERRLRLSAHSFVRPFVLVFMPLLLVGAASALAGRRRLAGWLSGVPTMRAGLCGGLAATVLGAIANDSGAVMLEIGAVYLLAFVGFAWAERGVVSGGRTID